MDTVTIGGVPVGDGHPPRVMSVLNMSPRSGYKPSVYTDPEDAAAIIDDELVPAGADIIDIGLQSANPKYEAEPVDYELERLEAAAPVLDYIESDVPVSLETRYAEVAEAAIGYGFDVINDVCGFADPAMKPTVMDHDMPVIKMASPPDLSSPGAVKTIDDIFEALLRDGFTDRTVIDPAFGGWYDGREFEDNWELFRRLREFRAFGRPILTATNREDFLGALAGKLDTDAQLAVSLAAATLEVDRGAHIIRTHDTETTADVVQVADALREPRITTPAEPTVVELPGVSRREAARHARLGASRTQPPTDAVTLSFLIGDVPATTAERIAGIDTDAAIVDRDDGGLYIAGTPPQLEALATELSDGDGPSQVVADRIQAAIARGQ